MRKFLNQAKPHLFFLLQLAILSLVGFQLTSPCLADTNVGGYIRTNTVWTADKSPYILTSSIIVNPGVTLTIQPGVEVRLDEGKGIQVDGTLIARGTEQAKIIFTNSTVNKPWGYILFTDSSQDACFDNKGAYVDGSILEYCIVEYANGKDREGAIVCEKASPFINYCQIRNNATSGLRVKAASGLIVANSTIEKNTSSSNDGGGIKATDNSSLTITSCAISNNKASSGGGVYCDAGTLTITSSQISNNTASYNGGGVCCYSSTSSGTLTINSSQISNNTASGSGGGVCCSSSSSSSGTLTINSSQISNNTANDSGGGVFCSGTLTINSSQISNNTASGSGGGVCCYSYYSVTLTISSSQISNNTASYNGGGVCCYSSTSSGTLTISSSVISSNTASNTSGNAQGGGIWVRPGDKVQVSYSLIMDNSANKVPAMYCHGSGSDSPSLKLVGNTFVGNNFVKNTYKGSIGAVYIAGFSSYTINHNNFCNLNLKYELYRDDPSTSSVADAAQNYWCIEDEEEIRELIFDFGDDSSKARVEYYPFLTAPDPNAPLPTFYKDSDQDNYGDTSQAVQALVAPQGYVNIPGDCNDRNKDIHPGAPELCNGLDDDCDGQVDENLTQLCPDGKTIATCQNGQWIGCSTTPPSPPPSILCGDADGNGSVDIGDALLIAEYDVGLKSSSQLPGFKGCDVTKDGVVDLCDALMIAEYDVGLVQKLECK